MKKVLLYIWQLPQNIYGLIIRLIWPAEKKLEYRGKTIRINSKFPGGISLGETIYVNKYPTNKNLWKDVKHEWGHSVQSKRRGWFYMPTVGLPSITFCGIDTLFHKGWDVERFTKWYYNLPWEKDADKKGSVDRWNTL